jgi:hypothetical protein
MPSKYQQRSEEEEQAEREAYWKRRDLTAKIRIQTRNIKKKMKVRNDRQAMAQMIAAEKVEKAAK